MTMTVRALLALLLTVPASLAHARIFQDLYTDELATRIGEAVKSERNSEVVPTTQTATGLPASVPSAPQSPQALTAPEQKPEAQAAATLSPEPPLTAEEASPKQGLGYKAPTYGAVLPRSVLRMTLNDTRAHATGGFDEAGHRVHPGLDLHVHANTFALQYGLSDQLTILAGFAHYRELNLRVNDDFVRKTDLYNATMSQQKASIKASAMARARESIAQTLATQGACPSVTECNAAIENGQVKALPVDVARMGYKAGSNLQAALDAYGDSVASVYEPTIDQGIRNAFASKAGGAPGAGDAEMGLAYAWIQKANLHLSTAMSLRMPTGRYQRVPLGLPTAGSGKTTVSFLALADVQLVPSLWASATWRIEQDLGRSKARSGVVTQNKFNDHAENIFLSFAPGALSPWFKALVLSVGQNFQERSSFSLESELDGVTSKVSYPAANMVSRVVTVELDLVQYGLPLMFTHSVTTPISGRNLAFAARKEEFNAILFWKF